jgi:hypothetical protein
MANYTQPDPKPTTDTAKPDEPNTLKRVQDDIEEWEEYYRSYRQRHTDAWKLWNNERVKQQFVGDFDSFDPMTFQMVESNVDNVYASRPKVAFMPRNRYQETDTKILQGMWDRTWDDNNTDFYLPIMGREATNIGNMITFDCWYDSPDGGYVKTEHIPFPDCVLDAAATDQFHIKKAGFRKLVRLDDLKTATKYDRKSGKWVPRYDHLDEVSVYGSTGSPLLDEELKAMLVGSTLNESGKKGQVELTYMVYLDKIVEVINRKTVVFEDDSPYHKESYEIQVQDQNEEGDKLFDNNNVPDGIEMMDETAAAQALTPVMKKITVPAIDPFIPIAMHSGYKDGAVLIAKGDTETFADTQEDLNDSINMNKEDIARNVRGVIITNKSVVQPDEEEEISRAQSGSVIGVTGGKANVDTLNHESMSQGVQFEINRSKQSIRDTARIAEVVQGLNEQTQQTATEINAQVSQATSGFRTKTLNLEAGYYKQRAENWIKLIQIFTPNENNLVRVNSRLGVEFQLYKPSQYWGLFDVNITLEINAKAEQQKKAQMALAAYNQFKDSPYWNRFELEKYVAEKAFDLDEDQLKLMMNANPQNATMMGGVPGGDVMGGSPTGLTPQSTPVASPVGPANAQ